MSLRLRRRLHRLLLLCHLLPTATTLTPATHRGARCTHAHLNCRLVHAPTRFVHDGRPPLPRGGPAHLGEQRDPNFHQQIRRLTLAAPIVVVAVATSTAAT